MASPSRVAASQQEKGVVPTFWDFDGRERGAQSLVDVMTDATRTLGHGFVLAAALHYQTPEEWARFLSAWDKRLADLRRNAVRPPIT